MAIKKEGELKTCTRCKRMFRYFGFGHLYCPTCQKIDEDDFEKVRSYIYEHGTATALEVSEATEVSLKHIEQFLKDGRLEIPETSPIFIKCEQCRTNIRSGRFCSECASRMSKALREELGVDEFQIGEKPKIKKTGKMHFIGKEK